MFSQELHEACERKIENPPVIKGETDPYTIFFAKALDRTFSTDPAFAEEITYHVAMKRENNPFPASFALESLQRIFQMDQMQTNGYPYKSERTWHTKVQEWASKDPRRIGDIMQMHDVGSDLYQRAAGVILALQLLLPERVGDPDEPLNILMVGSSRDHTLAMLAAPRNYMRFDHVTVESTAKDPIQETVLNSMINEPLDVGLSCGVDLWPLRDDLRPQFVEACSFFPSELKDLSKRAAYQKLERIRDESVIQSGPDTGKKTLLHAAANFGKVRGKEIYWNDKTGIDGSIRYDVVAYLTCMYQNYPEKQDAMIETGQRLMKPRAVEIIQDFLPDISPTHTALAPSELRFTGPTQRPFSYKTLVRAIEQGKPLPELKVLAEWNNGRAETLRPAPLFDKLVSLGKVA